MKHVVNNTEAADRIESELPFVNSGRSLRGGPSGPLIELGKLPEQYHDAVKHARYVVHSYRTPIGWVDNSGQKTIPDVGYSLSTGQHQYTVAGAWGIDFRPARGREIRRAGTGTRAGYYGGYDN
jgi:hypothetical protein